MRTKKLFWLILSLYIEAVILAIGSVLHIIYAYGGVFWAILAASHFCFSYKRGKKYNLSWYKEWNIFYGLANACLSVFLFLIKRTFSIGHSLDYRIMLFEIFLVLSWFMLLLWSGFVANTTQVNLSSQSHVTEEESKNKGNGD